MRMYEASFDAGGSRVVCHHNTFRSLSATASNLVPVAGCSGRETCLVVNDTVITHVAAGQKAACVQGLGVECLRSYPTDFGI